MSTNDLPRTGMAPRMPTDGPPFQPVRDTHDLVEVFAMEVLPAVVVELLRAGNDREDPLDVAREYGRARIEADRLKLYASVLSVMASTDVLLYNAHELRLLGRLADSLELSR